jgi:membrane fusion protein (multidrug efflux system)
MRITAKKAAIGSALLVLLFLLLLLSRGKRGEGNAPPTAAPDEATGTVVTVEKVVPRDIIEYSESNGVAQAWQEADISSEVSGKVKTIFAEVGDTLKAGNPLFKLNDELLTLQVEKARSLVTQLEGNYLSSKRDLSRKEKLYKDGVIAEWDLDLARAKEKADRGLLEGAQTSLKIAQRDLRETTIRSPIEGSLAERLVDIGTTVTPQMKVASVVDTRKIRIRIGVSEHVISKIRKGQPVTISADAFPHEAYQATVFSVGMKADETTLTFPVEVALLNDREPSLKPGMVARLKIQTENHSQVILIPQDVIRTESGTPVVFVVQDGRAQTVAITPDRSIDSQIIVKEGLSFGDLLVTVGSQTIADGQKVVVQE